MRENVPRHVAVIMDGNGRWAKKRSLQRSAGHSAGMRRMIALSDHAFDVGVKVLTLFALSRENLNRPKAELEALFKLFRTFFSENINKLEEKKIALRVIGERSLLPEDIQALIKEGEERTKGGDRATLVLAVAYGGRQDVLCAVNRAIERGEKVDFERFSALLSTAGLPEPDLLIRTGKEKRISNFLLFELAYTELYFSKKMFPSFSARDFDRALCDYASRERRYGKVRE